MIVSNDKEKQRLTRNIHCENKWSLITNNEGFTVEEKKTFLSLEKYIDGVRKYLFSFIFF